MAAYGRTYMEERLRSPTKTLEQPLYHLHYRRVDKGNSTKQSGSNVASTCMVGKSTFSSAHVSNVRVENAFSVLNDDEGSEWNDTTTWQHTQQALNVLNESDSDVDEEITLDDPWERFKELLRACPHHEFTELTQVDTFYNGLNDNEQDSLNAAAGGNLLSKTTREALNIIENKSKDMLRNMQSQINSLKGDLKNEIQNTIKSQQAVMMNQQTTFQNNLQNMICGLFQNQASTSGTLPSNTIPNPKVRRNTENPKGRQRSKEQTNFQGSTAQIPPPVIPISIPEPDVPKTLPKTTPIPESDIPKSLPKPNIPYPSRRDDQKSRDKASNQMEKIFQIFQDLRFDISFADALLLMPRFVPTIKSLLMNKDKLLELAKIPLNENCSAMLLKKLPEKLGDPGKFLILCNFPGIDVCHALADLGASINLMPLSIWKKLSLPELTPTRMTLELADRSITYPKGLAEEQFVKVGKFHFPTDFVVVDFEADPRVPLILGRSFLRTGRALIDVL
ncbi:reverse transcriptase domain-containing protein [Tanacetum coccineum]